MDFVRVGQAQWAFVCAGNCILKYLGVKCHDV